MTHILKRWKFMLKYAQQNKIHLFKTLLWVYYLMY